MTGCIANSGKVATLAGSFREAVSVTNSHIFGRPQAKSASSACCWAQQVGQLGERMACCQRLQAGLLARVNAAQLRTLAQRDTRGRIDSLPSGGRVDEWGESGRVGASPKTGVNCRI